MLNMSKFKNRIKPFHKPIGILLSLLFWAIIWWIASAIYGRPLLLPSPLEVIPRAFGLLFTSRFWLFAGRTILTLFLGYLFGSLLGFLLGVITAKSPIANALFTPLFSMLRATPVACFIIIAWVFLGSSRLPAVIAGLMVAPVMMTNVASGVKATPTPLLETAKVLKLSLWDKIRACYLPTLLPYLSSGLITSAGLAWKSGIAAEVIALSADTLGFAVYEAKSWNMDTTELFALTILIALFALLGEWLLSLVLHTITKKRRTAHANT